MRARTLVPQGIAMKIESSTLALAGSHALQARRETRERLQVEAAPATPPAEPDAVVAVKSIPPPEVAADAVVGDPHLALIKLMVEAMTGETIKVAEPVDPGAAPAVEWPALTGTEPRPGNVAVNVDRTERVSESEATTFTARGTVKTADGQQVSFTLQASMVRTFESAQSTSLREGPGKRTDPIVLNFHGNAAQLHDVLMDFDLDGNGRAEKVATLGSGSAWLVFDRNGNGKADNGGELFGPGTGNGYAELAALDGDRNGWIDAGDAAYRKLSVWSPGSGPGLTSLEAAGVGAIATASAATPFALRGPNNAALGDVRSTSVWLTDGGEAKTSQQVDLRA